MITLIQYPRGKDVPSISPFCLKLETYFKATNTPYENKFTVSTAKTTKKKMPVILDNGQLIEDSSFVIDHLKQKHQIDLDKNLSSEQKAVTQSFKWLCEKNMVPIIMHYRWVDKINWPKFRDIVFAGAPWFIKATIANSISKNVQKNMYGMGLGRFSDSEKLELLDQDLKAISDYLSNKKYFFGDNIHMIDTVLFTTLTQIEKSTVTPQLNPLFTKYPNLKIYTAHMMKQFWPEFI
jgi:glutathione S-transferase